MGKTCPHCGEPIPAGRGRPRVTCGAEACRRIQKTIYNRRTAEARKGTARRREADRRYNTSKKGRARRARYRGQGDEHDDTRKRPGGEVPGEEAR